MIKIQINNSHIVVLNNLILNEFNTISLVLNGYFRI